MRRKLGSTVVDAARAVQYTNAGTFEFLLDDKGNFFFLEVNTRLQVEHPVTEFLTGVDIVKEQIRIAAGERLSFKQGDVTFTGHAIECRINAEDPETFAPSPGVIRAFSVPGGPGVRVDTFAHAECTIPPYYDSLIAKIIVHGRDRQEAIARMRRTLEMTVIEGIKTSIPLHLRILKEPDFVAGRLSTSFMERFIAGKEAGRAPRRSRSSVAGGDRAILYPIIDADVCAARRLEPARGRRRLPAGGARLLQVRAKSRGERPLFSIWPTQSSRGARARRRARRRQRPRRHRRAVRAPTACTSGRTICRSPTARPIVGRGATRPLDAHAASRSTARSTATPSYVAVGPVFAHGHQARPATPRAASSWCAMPPAAASRSWPSAASP